MRSGSLPGNQSLPELADVTDPEDSDTLFEPWRTEPPTPVKRPERLYFFTGGFMRQQENAIARFYEAQHKLHMGDFSTVEEYRDLRDDVEEGRWVLECWRLGGELTPPRNPYKDRKQAVRYSRIECAVAIVSLTEDSLLRWPLVWG